MDNDQILQLIERMKGLWPRMDLDGPQGEVWSKRFRKLPHQTTLAALDSLFATSKYAPKPVEVESRVRLLSESAKSDADKPPPETWVQQLRRMHRIPETATDAEVLIWNHSCQAKRAIEVYRGSFPNVFPTMRQAFRREWLQAGLPEAEYGSAEASAFS